jgi:uncharacterized heparinase superfamily protein
VSAKGAAKSGPSRSSGLGRALGALVDGLPLPARWVGGGKARHMLFAAPDPWPGAAARGAARLARGISFAGTGKDDAPPPALHRFDWLRDLRALGGAEARERAQGAVGDWIERYGEGRLGATGWDAATLAERVQHWVAQYEFFGKGANEAFRAAFFGSLARQAKALARAPAPRDVPTGLGWVKALIAFGANVPGAKRRFWQGVEALDGVIAAIGPEGNLPSRNPADQLAALRDLVDIRALLAAAHCEPPLALFAAIERLGPMLRYLRQADGGLPHFHGGVAETSGLVDAVLSMSGTRGAAPVSAPASGYERVAAGHGLLLFDAGAPPPPGHDRFGHAGSLAFEFGYGRSRLVVNGGGYRGDEPVWQDAVRLTAAHSTLVLADRNSSKVERGGGLGRLAAATPAVRAEDHGDTMVSGAHDGYVRRFGFVHRRRLFLSRDGDDLRGEDRLDRAPDARVPRKSVGAAFAVRFHLHPAVEAASPERDAEGRAGIVLAHPEAGLWRLVAEGGELAVDDSFYLADGEHAEPSRQIVLAGTVPDANGAAVKWALRKTL